jgi:hypothetical protein
MLSSSSSACAGTANQNSLSLSRYDTLFLILVFIRSHNVFPDGFMKNKARSEHFPRSRLSFSWRVDAGSGEENPWQEAVLRLLILIQVSPARPLAGPMGESGCRRPYRKMLQWSMQPPLRSRYFGRSADRLVPTGAVCIPCSRSNWTGASSTGSLKSRKQRAQGVAGADQPDQGRSIVVE